MADTDNALHTAGAGGSPICDMGEALHLELKAPGMAWPGRAACNEIIARMFERSAQMARERPLTAREADEIAKRGI